MLSRHLLISGTVQGVGFRDAMQAEAHRLGVRGWVRNRRDGSVEALLQGPDAAVEALTSWAHRGPRLARVTGVAVEARPPEEPAPAGFERLPSA